MKNKKGFTLLELIVVIIIIGVLAALGFVQYTQMVEKGRRAEARTVLGSLRSLQFAYWEEYGIYGATLAALRTGVPSACAAGSNYYFSYSVAAATGTGTATRCTGALGKTPGVAAANVYSINLTMPGVYGGAL